MALPLLTLRKEDIMSRTRTLIVVAGLVLLIAACGGAEGDNGDAAGGGDGDGGGGDPIVLGGIFDLTGPTGDVGTPYAEGVRDFISQLNEDGGIDGREINLMSQDYQYDVALAEQLYSQYQGARAVAILGWGTADTEALRGRVSADELPYFSGSLSEELADPQETPYNFLVGTTYSDQMRIALKYINEQTGGDANIAVFHHDSPFGESPVADGRQYVEDQGFGFEYSAYPMPGDATDYTALLSRAQGATHIIVQNVASPAAQLAQDIANQGADAQMVCLNWCTDEEFVELAGDAAEGVLGVTPWAPASVGTEGVQEVVEASGNDDVGGHYLQGWYYAELMTTAIAELVEAGEEVTGPNLKTALEETEPFDTGGVSPPIDFSADDHKGMTVAPIFEVTDGTWNVIEEGVEP